MEFPKINSLPKCRFAHIFGDEKYEHNFIPRKNLIEITYIKEGALILTRDDGVLTASSGDILVNFFLEDIRITSESYHCHHTVGFSAEFDSVECRLPIVIVSGHNSTQIYHLIDEIIKFKSLYPDRMQTVSGLFLQLMDELQAEYSSTEHDIGGEFHYVRKAKQYIYDNIRLPIKQQAIADFLGITPEYLCSVFKRGTGESVIKFVNRMKLDGIRALMERENIPLYRAAEFYGFSDPNYVSRLYSKYYGISITDDSRLQRRKN